MFPGLNKHYTRNSDGRIVQVVGLLDELTPFMIIMYRRLGQNTVISKPHKEFLEEFTEVEDGS